eukprot:CAMPEP_0113520216 /NCGR_PEP_ID=MMETSP0014_2-20120614/43952_1 /TAXON_ID=2857 /ORGANISM="Nitzschia sp." /LENGTH=448 /DNA_ID=CAMNT_0000418021 /DNA_START=178 /DNA_END=1524 /DNA_ORIENTATION=- /assembly_acc=CAM_ASM_000159
MPDDGVQEATAALKGMLGIGGNGKAPAPAQAPSSNSQDQGQRQTQSKKPKKNKKKMNRQNTGDSNVTEDSAVSTKSNGGGRSKKKKNKGGGDNQNQNQKNIKKTGNVNGQDAPSGGKGKKNSNHTTPAKQTKSSSGTAPTTHFAASNTYASPSASQLPMPTFSPSPSKTQKIIKDLAATEGDSGDAATTSNEIPDSSGGGGGGGGLASKTVPSLAPKREEPVDVPAEEEKPTSKTGINIAAMAASPKHSPASQSHKDFVDATSNTVAAAGSKLMHPNAQNLIPPQQQQQMLPRQVSPQGFGMSSPPPHHHPPTAYGGGQQPFLSPGAGGVGGPPMPSHPSPYASPPPQRQQQPPVPQHPPPPPHGYALIQVQVPPQIAGIGGPMMVPSPAGFPVQIMVPPGCAVGQVLPVHVPCVPLHMLPPPGQVGPGPGGPPPPPHHYPGGNPYHR